MKVGVYGLGRFGSFWAQLLSRSFDVYGYNRSPKPRFEAPIPLVDIDELAQCDVVFLCVAISAIEDVVSDLAPRLRPGTLVIDTCSVKVLPLRAIERHLGPEMGIIGTHPMFGPDSAKDGVSGLPLVLVNVRSSQEQYRLWRRSFAELGLRVLERTAEEHDREAAFTQGVTHLVGRLLGEMSLESSEIATLGYQKLLQVIEQTCNDPWQLFLDLQRNNPYTEEMRNAFLEASRRILEHPSLTGKPSPT
jgi:prephenate dehydrogenase